MGKRYSSKQMGRHVHFKLVSQYKPDNIGTTCMVAEDGVRRGHRRSHRTGPDPTNFWDSNMGPALNFVAKY